MLYWYKSTNTDAEGLADAAHLHKTHRRRSAKSVTKAELREGVEGAGRHALGEGGGGDVTLEGRGRGDLHSGYVGDSIPQRQQADSEQREKGGEEEGGGGGGGHALGGVDCMTDMPRRRRVIPR